MPIYNNMPLLTHIPTLLGKGAGSREQGAGEQGAGEQGAGEQGESFSQYPAPVPSTAWRKSTTHSQSMKRLYYPNYELH